MDRPLGFDALWFELHMLVGRSADLNPRALECSIAAVDHDLAPA